MPRLLQQSGANALKLKVHHLQQITEFLSWLQHYCRHNTEAFPRSSLSPDRLRAVNVIGRPVLFRIVVPVLRGRQSHGDSDFTCRFIVQIAALSRGYWLTLFN